MAPTAEETAQTQLLVGLKFPEEAAKSIIKQGFVGLEELKELGDDEVENLCKIVRRPRGTKTSGSARGATADPGTNVPMLAESNLKLTCYFIMHKLDRVSREITREDVTLENVKALKDLKKEQDEWKAPDKDNYPTIMKKNWPHTFDELNEFMADFVGKSGIPLEYVIRTSQEMPKAEDDPEDNYETPKGEMAKRAPHFVKVGGKDKPHPTYSANNQLVWENIHQILDMSRKIAALKSKQKEAITVDSDDETSQTSNRSNKALTKSSLRKKN